MTWSVFPDEPMLGDALDYAAGLEKIKNVAIRGGSGPRSRTSWEVAEQRPSLHSRLLAIEQRQVPVEGTLGFRQLGRHQEAAH